MGRSKSKGPEMGGRVSLVEDEDLEVKAYFCILGTSTN